MSSNQRTMKNMTHAHGIRVRSFPLLTWMEFIDLFSMPEKIFVKVKVLLPFKLRQAYNECLVYCNFIVSAPIKSN